jgi:ABC-type maltose transport system permease subunit
VQFGEDYGNPPSEQLAIAVLATIPVFLLFLVFQRSINRGFGLSGLK